MKGTTAFQLNKIKRLIRVQGESFTFTRAKLSEYGEPTKGEGTEVVIQGVYHEVNSQVTEKASAASVTRSKPQPRILCTLNDGQRLQQGDMLEYKGTRYRVIEAANLLQYDVCIDVSLEVVEVGK